jgi:hypothetical protein
MGQVERRTVRPTQAVIQPTEPLCSDQSEKKVMNKRKRVAIAKHRHKKRKLKARAQAAR